MGEFAEPGLLTRKALLAGTVLLPMHLEHGDGNGSAGDGGIVVLDGLLHLVLARLRVGKVLDVIVIYVGAGRYVSIRYNQSIPIWAGARTGATQVGGAGLSLR